MRGYNNQVIALFDPLSPTLSLWERELSGHIETPLVKRWNNNPFGSRCKQPQQDNYMVCVGRSASSAPAR